jgi:hypothetical protein
MKVVERVCLADFVFMRLPSHETGIPVDTQASFLQISMTISDGFR